MRQFKIIAFTHKCSDLKDLAKFYLDEGKVSDRLHRAKTQLNISEILYLATCNRIEFFFVCEQEVTPEFLHNFFNTMNPSLGEDEITWAVNQALVFEGDAALRHVFEVASSIDSLVVGEREIITQVRKAYDNCKALNTTGDLLRMVVQHAVKTAKDVFTHTSIARNPVSVVSLAYRKLKDLHVPEDSRFVIVGAGLTNSTMAKYLRKHGFKNFSVFNRTLANAQTLAAELYAPAYPLEELRTFNKGFDVLIACTSAATPLITEPVYQALLSGDTSKKIVIDLGVPNDVDPGLVKKYPFHLIEVDTLRGIAKKNMEEREKELVKASVIIDTAVEEFRQQLRVRKMERAMQDIPQKVKEIRRTAVHAVFAKDIEQLDPHAREVLDKVLAYVEKKYISVPMVIAKEKLLDPTIS